MRFRDTNLKGLSSIMRLKQQLSRAGYFFRYKADEFSRVIYIIYSPYKQLDIYKLHPNTLIIDATYKTNKFNLALFNIVSVSNIGNASF